MEGAGPIDGSMPLIGSMSRDGSNFGGEGFGQLLNDEEGTECVIDDFRPSRPEGSDPADETHHPAMCGQAFFSKVIGSKKKKSMRGMLSSPQRYPLFYLRKNYSKSALLDDHETFSLEQPQDSASESGMASHSSNRDRFADPPDGTPPPYIVQFDPNDLTLIQMEKEQSDATKIMSHTSLRSKKSTMHSLRKGEEKNGRKSSAVASPFCPIVLPTVTEEMSFDLLESPSSAEPLPCRNPATAHLLPSVSSTSSSSYSSSSSCFSFFRHVNSTEDESRDDLEELIATVKNRGPFDDNDVLEDAAPSSPEMIQILTAMRQIILKQQDAIQVVSQENMEFRQQLVLCQEELRTIQSESAEQLIQITQLVIQKQGLENVTERLKAKLEGLRQEVSLLQLQEEDVDLAHRFAHLMCDVDEEKEEEAKNDISAAAVEEVPSPATSPIINVDRIIDDASWRRLMSSFDSSSMDGGTTKSPPRHTAIPEEEEGLSMKDRSPWKYSQPSSSLVENSAPRNSFSSSSSTFTGPRVSHVDRRTSEDVVEFKSRLEEMQQKRLRRAQGPGRKSPSVRFA